MKFLYCILAICAAVTSEPVPQNPEQLKKTTANILKEIEHAPETIDDIVDEAKLIVAKKLWEHELVKNLHSIQDELLEKKKLLNSEGIDESPETIRLHDCSIVISLKFVELVDEIGNELLENLTVDKFVKEGESLATLRNKLSNMKDRLRDHTDEEIKTCLDSQSNCKLNEEFLSTSEDYFTFENLLKPTLLSTIESYDRYFNSPELENKIDTELTHPGYECLKGSEQ